MTLRWVSRTTKRHHAGLPWTRAETAVLEELYPDHTEADLAIRLGRSEWSVKGKARNLGLSKDHSNNGGQSTRRNCSPWSTIEIRILVKLHSTTPYEEIAERIGRSRNAVHMKARKLGLRKMLFWTRDEDRLLRDEQAQRQYDQVASILKRTLGSVKARAITLKLERKVDPWTEGEIRTLARDYREAVASDIGRKIGRTEAAVAQKALRVGIVKKPRWSEAEIKVLYELSAHQTSREIAGSTGRSSEAVRGKLKQLGLNKKRNDKSHDSLRIRPSDQLSITPRRPPG